MKKYHIDTIPVWDAYDQKDQCPLCVLEYKSERDYVDFFLSGSVMEPDTRISVNKTGFCSHHFKLLYNEKNRLGLALITHTHLGEKIEEFKELAENLDTKKRSFFSDLGMSLSKKGDPSTEAFDVFMNWLDEHHKSCMICSKIDNLLDRYAFTILHLWQKDKAFLEVLEESKGFCLHHFKLIMEVAKKNLSKELFRQWTDLIIPIESNALDQLDKDLLWFTKKFDYRNENKPWGNSKDALPRTIQTISGQYMEPPKFKDD